MIEECRTIIYCEIHIHILVIYQSQHKIKVRNCQIKTDDLKESAKKVIDNLLNLFVCSKLVVTFVFKT